jgi:hypothetical protein
LRENAFDQTAIYRNGDGADEPTTLHFVPAHGVPPALAPAPEPPRLTCGEAYLQQQELQAAGLGKKHPDMLALDALLSQCTYPIEIAPAVCTRRRQQLDEHLRQGRGQNHPDVQAAKRSLEMCEAARAKPPG